MTIKQIIQKAQEGGYMPGYGLNLYPGGFVEVSAKDDETPNMPDRSLPDIFIDPAFWRALGKAMELVENNFDGLRGTWDDTRLETLYCWECLWHRFIDALANGQSPEQFFNQF